MYGVYTTKNHFILTQSQLQKSKNVMNVGYIPEGDEVGVGLDVEVGSDMEIKQYFIETIMKISR